MIGQCPCGKKEAFGHRTTFHPRPLGRNNKLQVQQFQSVSDIISPLHQIKREADRLVLSQFAPAGFLINDDLDIIQFRGDTGPFLQPANDSPGFHLTKMARQELVGAIREILDLARKNSAPVKKEHVQLMFNGHLMLFTLNVVPLRLGSPGGEPYFLILFAPSTVRPSLETDTAKVNADMNKAPNIQQMKTELAATQRYLQDLKEEHYAANEELRAAMEEAQSNNEELQSTVEERESTKEELQSNNEELNTINEEIYAKNNELVQANDDLNNLLASISLAFIILDEHGRIRRFSTRAKEAFNLIDSDIGRPLSDIKPNLDIPPLRPLIDETLQHLGSRSMPVGDSQGKEWLLKIRPYKTGENRIEGVVLLVQEKT